MASEAIERVETVRTRSARANIVFAFAIALVLATAYLMRQILNSRTYQLSSATRPGNEADAKFYSH